MQTAIIDAKEDRVHEGAIRTSVSLVDAAVRGDRGAFESLVEPHLAVALGAARLITGNESDAADALQDALLASWQSLDGLRNPQLFAAWFRKIVIRSSTRCVQRRRHLVEIDLESPDMTGSIDSVEREFDRRQLARAFARLGPKDRVLPYRQAGGAFDGSTPTQMSVFFTQPESKTRLRLSFVITCGASMNAGIWLSSRLS